MKVGHETPGGGHETNDVICQQVGFDGGDAKTLYLFQFVQSPYQIEECFPCFSSEISCIYSRENDFLDTLGSHVSGSLDHVLNGGTTATSASKGDGAVRTEVVAPVLNFQKAPGPITVRVGNIEVLDSENIAGMRFVSFLLFEVV